MGQLGFCAAVYRDGVNATLSAALGTIGKALAVWRPAVQMNNGFVFV
jgi:hypothetical protein